MIDHIDDGVYISGRQALRYADKLWEANIRHVLRVHEDVYTWPDRFTVCENPVQDATALPAAALNRGVAFIHEQVQTQHKVLVHCAAGISRSSTFVLAYLVSRGDDLIEAWQLLKSKHPITSPHPALIVSLIRHYRLSYTLADIVDLYKV